MTQQVLNETICPTVVIKYFYMIQQVLNETFCSRKGNVLFEAVSIVLSKSKSNKRSLLRVSKDNCFIIALYSTNAKDNDECEKPIEM